MYNQEVVSFLNEADEHLTAAQKEMYRPKEDVVPLMVCSNIRQAVVKYLSSLLANKGVRVDENPSIDSLLNQCREFDSDLKDLQMENILCACATEDCNFCNNIKKLEECVELAAETRKKVLKSIL